MLRAFLTVGGWTMASRVLGLVRDQLLAAFMGVGPLQDAYQLAFRLPNMFRRLFGEGAFNAAFVPLFSGLLTSEGPVVARGFAQEAMAVLSFWLLLLTLLGEIFMPQLIGLIAIGGTHPPGTLTLAVTLTRITFPYMLLICVAALLSGVLNALDRFAAASAAYVMFNVVGIAAILWLTPFVPTVAHAAAWGITASGVAQLGLLFWAVRRAGMKLHLPRPRLTPQMRVLMRRMAPGLVGSGVTQLNLAVDTIISFGLPTGSLSLIVFADRVNQLPLGVLGAAAGTSMLPLLARQIRAGETDAALTTQNRALDYTLILTLPACLGLMALAEPIMATLFAHGAFTLRDAALSAQSLMAYALGLPFFVLVKVLQPGFYARGDTSTPVRLGMITLALNFGLNLALMHPLQHVGPPLASSLAAIANTALLGGTLIRRGHFRADRKLLTRLGGMLLASCVMAALLWIARHGAASRMIHGATPSRIVALSLLVGLGALLYGVLLQVTGLIDLRRMGERIAARLRRPAGRV